MKILPARAKVREEDTWAMEDLYSTDQAWEQDYERLEKRIEEISTLKGTLGDSAESLCHALQVIDEISILQEQVYVYANQKLHEDTASPVYQGMAGKAGKVTVHFSSVSAFMTPEILKIPEAKIREFLNGNKELAVYRQYLMNILREKDHTLSDREERLLAAAGDMAGAADDIFAMFNNADLHFADVKDSTGATQKLTHGSYMLCLQSRDRVLRKDAFQKMHGAYQQFENTLAAAFTANIKKEMFYAESRRYPSTLAAALDDGNIPLSVYENLIEAVHEKLPALHRYVALRKKLLGTEELHMYDLYVPVVEDQEHSIPFTRAKEMVLEGLKPLGAEYLSLLKAGFDNRWIDVYENQGKRSGAYSWGAYGTHPYVLLNYQENLNNVFTLAHEMGHALHSYYSDEAQPYVYAGYKIFVAEVASTCNERLLIDHLIRNAASREEKAYLINYFLEQFRGTVFRQTMFAEFEKITHSRQEAGETLTAELLCEIYRELNQKYYGDAIVVDQEIAIEWARIPHFYRSFYVYQYATGFSAAVAISDRILKQGEPAVKDYKQFLKGGSSDYPIELLKTAGADISRKETIADALTIFEDYLGQLEDIML